MITSIIKKKKQLQQKLEGETLKDWNLNSGANKKQVRVNSETRHMLGLMGSVVRHPLALA